MKTTIKNNIKLLSASIALTLASGSLVAKTFDPDLKALLSAADDNALHQIIITFDQDGAPNAEQLAVLSALGIGGVSMNNLPIVGALATKAQIEAIYARDDVRSVWENEKIEFENYESTQLTGVQRLRNDQSMFINGMPISGRGIGVVVNDSGIDGTHNDIKYPDHVVQNVVGQTNVFMGGIVPPLYQEDVANTEVATGHGSHVAGIIGGNGAMSNGKHMGVAPGADIIGYGTGAYDLMLGPINGFDYALTHQFDYNIRVVSNSFGQKSDKGTDFQPDHPYNVATKKLADRGVVVVFSAGNSGSGESTITGNFKKAPWVITVAAGDKNGTLADFSSRGVENKGGTVVIDGETFTWEDRPTVTGPGVAVVSARSSSMPSNALSLSGEVEKLGPAEAPFYTHMSGTSMSAPHVSGIVALMLQVNPNLHWSQVKQILQDTATNMPGHEPWEVGAGYVNAYAAVKAAMEMDNRFGDYTKVGREYRASAIIEAPVFEDMAISFSPMGEPPQTTFRVSEDVALVTATGKVELGTAFVLQDPHGNRYSSGIGLAGVQENGAIVAPGTPGIWSLYMGGIGSVYGANVDPLALTNGVAAPESTTVTVGQYSLGGAIGIDDAIGHPAEGFIKMAVARKLMDATAQGFQPEQTVTKGELAETMMLFGGVRQADSGNKQQFIDADQRRTAAFNAVTAKGAAIKDRSYSAEGVVKSFSSEVFGAEQNIARQDLAYTLVQTMGLQAEAQAVNNEQPLKVYVFDQWVEIIDSMDIEPALRGHVQVAINNGWLTPKISVTQGDFDSTPILTAEFNPRDLINRATLAMSLTRLHIKMAN